MKEKETLKEIQLLLARHRNTPITNVEIFKKVLESKSKFEKFKNITITDNEWKSCLKDMWWHHSNYTPPHIREREFDIRLFELRDKLLEFGGSEVCLPIWEEDLSNILEYGQLWYSSFEMKKGEPCQCHRNSCYCWNKNKDFANGTLRICTGYALSEDGMWRQHSWLAYKTPRSTHIVETTEPRKLYFGFAMTTELCEKFYEQCV